MTEPKKQNFFWPNVGTLEGAKTAAGYGIVAAIIIATITTATAFVSTSNIPGFVDAWVYLVAALFAAIAFGIHKERRFAAVAGLALFLVVNAYLAFETGHFQGAAITVFLAMFFVSSVRGAFALHHLRTQSDDQQGVPAGS